MKLAAAARRVEERGELPDDVMVYVMPSRFVLPDELGHDAWQRHFAGDPNVVGRTVRLANAVTVNAAGGDDIDGSASATIAGGSRGALRLVARTDGWDIL